MPSFRTVGGDKNATDIQLLQLSSELDDSVTFQFLTAQRRSAAEYSWVIADDASYYKPGWPEGQGLWINEDMQFPEKTVLIAVGDAVQLDMGDYDEIPLNVAGQVSDSDLTYTTRAGYNYVGNPYPTANDIQNIQLSNELDDSVTFQFLTDKRRSAAEYSWVIPDDASYYKQDWPEGLGLWINEDMQFPEEPVTMKPGEAVQLDMGDYDGIELTVYAPIEL